MAHPLIEDVRGLLQERKLEVDRHLDFAKVLVDSKADHLAKLQGDKVIKVSAYSIDRSLIKTISATGYLLIYNLLESTMTSALHAIHQQVHDEELAFEQLNNKLQNICWKNFEGAISEKAAKRLQNMAINKALVSLGYHQYRHWSGNIDVKKIQAKAKAYGFEYVYVNGDYEDVKRNLLSIKDTRNALAHGRVSFEQCGQETAVDALIEYSQQAYAYLEVVLNGIEEYLENKGYVAEPA